MNKVRLGLPLRSICSRNLVKTYERRLPASDCDHERVISLALSLIYLTIVVTFGLPLPDPSDFTGGGPLDRILIILFSMSNQNGAPSESASTVSSKPNTFVQKFTDGGSSACTCLQVHPSGIPTLSIC